MAVVSIIPLLMLPAFPAAITIPWLRVPVMVAVQMLALG